jgi:tRNA threonylcarbamoyladenosine biosynthesis protein TsaE
MQSTSSEETVQYGEQLGSNLRGGEVIELASDLGGGKTTLVRGIARGMGSTDAVSSPSFTISKVYKSPRLELHHFDFYRLEDAGLMAHELHDVVGDNTVVIVAEWADVVSDVLPAQRIKISITKTGEESRRLDIQCPAALTYVLEGIC